MNTEQKLELGYNVALAQLREHPKIIWTRNNFFLLTQTGLLGFTLNADKQPTTNTIVTACVAGLFLASMWLWVNWAGGSLQRQWRGIVLEFEKKLFDYEIGVLQGPFHLAVKSGEGKYRRVSITLALMLLPAGFVVVWTVLLVQIYRR